MIIDLRSGEGVRRLRWDGGWRMWRRTGDGPVERHKQLAVGGGVRADEQVDAAHLRVRPIRLKKVAPQLARTRVQREGLDNSGGARLGRPTPGDNSSAHRRTF